MTPFSAPSDLGTNRPAAGLKAASTTAALSLHGLAVLDMLHGYALSRDALTLEMRPPLPGHLLPRLQLRPCIDASTLRIVRPCDYLQDHYDLQWPSTGPDSLSCGVYPVGSDVWQKGDTSLRAASQLLRSSYPEAAEEFKAVFQQAQQVRINTQALVDVRRALEGIIRQFYPHDTQELRLSILPHYSVKFPDMDLYATPLSSLDLVDLDDKAADRYVEDHQAQVDEISRNLRLILTSLPEEGDQVPQAAVVLCLPAYPHTSPAGRSAAGHA